MVETIVSHIRLDGFYVIEGVIPPERVDSVKESVLRVHIREEDINQRRQQEIREKGHRVGAQGVSFSTALINSTQEFSAYLTDSRVLGVAEAFFGPDVRVSSTGGIVTNPGNERGYWHADWPYNQTNSARVPSPYPDVVMHLSTIWMLTPFNAENGGTLLVPGSHRSNNNPSGDNGVDRDAPYPTEISATGDPGSVLIYDSRLWHTVAPNRSSEPRVAISVRYGPWWINLNPEIAGTPENSSMVVERNGKSGNLPRIPRDVFESLSQDVRPLFRHIAE